MYQAGKTVFSATSYVSYWLQKDNVTIDCILWNIEKKQWQKHNFEPLYGFKPVELINSMIEEANKLCILTATIDGKNVAYTNKTQFLVQVGKNKSAYKTRYSIVGNIGQAIMYYNGINVGNGYKKRLLVPSFNKPLLARQFSA